MEAFNHEGDSGNSDNSESIDDKKSRKRNQGLLTRTVESEKPEQPAKPEQAKSEPKTPEEIEAKVAEASPEELTEAAALVENDEAIVDKITNQELAREAKAEQSELTNDSLSQEELAGELAVDTLHDAIIETGDVDAGYEQALIELGMEADEIAATLAAETEARATDSAEEMLETDEAASEESELADEVVFDRATESFADEEPNMEDGEDPVVTATPISSTTTATPPVSAPFMTGGGAPATPPYGSISGPTGPGFGGPGTPGSTPNFNVAPPIAANHNTYNSNSVGQESSAGPVIVGLVVGYLIGRRRGRIKTEKKLLPVQKKLEKRVDDLQWELRRKEDSLRHIAAERVRQKGPALIEKLQITKSEAKQKSTPDSTGSETDQRRRAPEAHQLHGATKAPEQHIGQMLVTAEAPRLESSESYVQSGSSRLNPETVRTQAEAIKEVPKIVSPEKQAETMSRVELLSMSEKITVEGSTLRQIYETHLISERGLRRLVAEHLRGGDIKKVLKREIVEREIDFERDPAMRDVGSAVDTPVRTGAAAVTLDQMVERASAQVAGANEEAAYYKARTSFEAKIREQDKKHRRAVDAGLTLLIIFLIVCIVVLYLERH